MPASRCAIRARRAAQDVLNFSPKVGVQLYPTERVMVYGAWSKGYKTGGWTTR
jgi:outer membrane receptor protein involved in Fe transport